MNFHKYILFNYFNFRASSLAVLWGFINSLQILVLIPLFNINYPANAKFFNSFLINSIMFKFVNIKSVVNQMFNITETDPLT